MRLAARTGLASVILWSCALGAGCGDDDRPTLDAAAGFDAGAPVVDAASDAARPDAALADAGTVECTGMPPTCASLDLATCATVAGCVQVQCIGFAISCVMRTPAQCMAAAGTGCTWAGTACEGTTMPCSSVSDEALCVANTGCMWDPTTVCRGTPTACERLTHDACATQPGCTVFVAPMDAGPPMPDAGCGTFDGGIGAADVDVRVVEGPNPVTPAAGAHVRVESLCGGSIEAVTAADGTAHFTLPRAVGQWDLTAAMAGHAAVSVLDVTNVPVVGDIRLDPLTRPMDVPHAVRGTLGGAIGVGNTVQIDAFNFDTIAMASATWNSNFYAGTLSLRQPLLFVALEIDPAGRAVNVATTEVARTEADVMGVTLSLPAPRVTPAVSTVLIRLPAAGGMISAGAVTPVGAFAERLSTLDQGEYVFTGTAQVTVVGANLQVTVQHFAGPAATSFAGATADGPGARLNAYTSDPGAGGEIVVGPGTISMYGASLADLIVEQTGASGIDAVVIHIGESMMEGPHWRVIAPTLPRFTRVPHLPSAVSLGDIGLTPASSTSVLPLFIKMETGTVWAARAANQGVEGYQYTLAPGYQTISTSGR